MTHRIITIGRQFGSGGHEIGQEIADRLGIQCYDKELITMAAAHGDLPRSWLADFDEQGANPWLYESAGHGSLGAQKDRSASAALFNLQSDVIRMIAGREDAVIVGRCADCILRGREGTDLLTVFIAAPFEARVKRKMRLARLTQKKAEALVKRTDHQRAMYYHSYTGLEWGRRNGYDLYFDSQAQSKEAIIGLVLARYACLGQ